MTSRLCNVSIKMFDPKGVYPIIVPSNYRLEASSPLNVMWAIDLILLVCKQQFCCSLAIVPLLAKSLWETTQVVFIFWKSCS